MEQITDRKRMPDSVFMGIFWLFLATLWTQISELSLFKYRLITRRQKQREGGSKSEKRRVSDEGSGSVSSAQKCPWWWLIYDCDKWKLSSELAWMSRKTWKTSLNKPIIDPVSMIKNYLHDITPLVDFGIFFTSWSLITSTLPDICHLQSVLSHAKSWILKKVRHHSWKWFRDYNSFTWIIE